MHDSWLLVDASLFKFLSNRSFFKRNCKLNGSFCSVISRFLCHRRLRETDLGKFVGVIGIIC